MCTDGLPLRGRTGLVKVRARSRAARPRIMWPVSHALLVLVSQKTSSPRANRAPRRVLEQHQRVQRRPAQVDGDALALRCGSPDQPPCAPDR